MTVYELTNNYQALYELLASGDIDVDTFNDTLEAMGFDEAIEDRADGYAKVLKSLEGDVAGIKAEEERLASRRRTVENNCKRLKENLQNLMQLTGKTKFKTTLFSFNIQKNPPSVEIADDAAVPERYLVAQAPKIDKKAIISDLKAGAEIDGITLKQGESLRIR